MRDEESTVDQRQRGHHETEKDREPERRVNLRPAGIATARKMSPRRRRWLAGAPDPAPALPGRGAQ
jgi:hypothetical protein